MEPTENAVDGSDIEGNVCVVTGGSGELGSAMAKSVGRSDGKVVLLARGEEKLQKTSDELAEMDVPHSTLSASVLNPVKLEAAAETAVDKYGSVDILINAAGGDSPAATTGSDTSFFDITKDSFENVLGVNFVGTALASQAFGEHIVEQGEGVILNMSPMNSFTSLTNIPAYSGAKATVSNFTEWLAVYMSHNYSTDIRVNAIAPGFFSPSGTGFC